MWLRFEKLRFVDGIGLNCMFCDCVELKDVKNNRLIVSDGDWCVIGCC